MGIWARPLINNAVTKSLRDLFKFKKAVPADTE
jgi:hypothetical protein